MSSLENTHSDQAIDDLCIEIGYFANEGFS